LDIEENRRQFSDFEDEDEDENEDDLKAHNVCLSPVRQTTTPESDRSRWSRFSL
jgi:hypothetical protein